MKIIYQTYFSNMAQKAPIHLFKFENFEYIQEYNMWNVKELAISEKYEHFPVVGSIVQQEVNNNFP